MESLFILLANSQLEQVSTTAATILVQHDEQWHPNVFQRLSLYNTVYRKVARRFFQISNLQQAKICNQYPPATCDLLNHRYSRVESGIFIRVQRHIAPAIVTITMLCLMATLRIEIKTATTCCLKTPEVQLYHRNG